METSSSKRKFDAMESSIDAPLESHQNEKICGICKNAFDSGNSSKACPESDKHDFHEKCLAK